ncbi:MAG: hypothetical protein ABIU54_12665 [Candidatus Eisenbacteria bacterium]
MSTSPPGQPQAPAANQATSREFLSVIFRRKWLIIGLFVVVTGTVLAVAMSTPVSYSSTGRVLIVRGEQQSALSPGRTIFSEWEEDLGSEVEVTRSYPVLTRVRELLAEQSARTGRKITLDPGSIDVEVMGKSNVLGLGYSNGDGEVAQIVCSALITAYTEYRQNRLSMGKPEGFFEGEILKIDQELSTRLSQRSMYSTRTGVTDPEGQSRAWEDQLGALEQKANETAAEVAEAQASLNSMREMQQQPEIDLPTLGMPFSNESALVSLKQKIVEQQTRIANLRERYRDDAAEVVNAKETLETLQALLRREVEARLTMSQSRMSVLKSRLVSYNRDIAALHAKLSGIPQSLRSIDELDADIKNLRARYDELSRARDLARITANTSHGFNVVLLNPAGAPVPQNTRDYVRLALAPAFSLVVGIGLAFFLDGLDLTVRTANQAEEYLELPVLASLSNRRNKRG